ncbi:hypothetical protein KIL84_001341 [Mauremys mutica]|uniref:Uncharacterized protein n=1 Tax=Mauremys mutica TaxID=74926 RepID=A0A9D4AVM5_9SAUR|nr:hypothetical protein KIL84_001341 [Mauremys mutica]
MLVRKCDQTTGYGYFRMKNYREVLLKCSANPLLTLCRSFKYESHEMFPIHYELGVLLRIMVCSAGVPSSRVTHCELKSMLALSIFFTLFHQIRASFLPG